MSRLKMRGFNKKAAAGIGLGAAALIGGTFAYYNQSTSLDNPLSTGDYTTQMVEEYTPPTDDLKPGTKWDKTVGAENTGDYPVLVRVKMDEKWSRKGQTEPYKTLDSEKDKEKFNSGTYENNAFTANQPDTPGEDVGGDEDGLLGPENDPDHTVVYKDLKLAGKDSDSKWIDGGDGYWYWNGVLEEKAEPGEEENESKTTNLLEHIIIATNIDLGRYETTEYYAIAAQKPDADSENGWTKTELPKTDLNGDGLIDIRDLLKKLEGEGTTVEAGENLYRKSESKLADGKLGYADSNYTLTITTEFVQATKDAVTEAWGDADGSKLEKLDNIEVDKGDGVNLVNKNNKNK